MFFFCISHSSLPFCTLMFDLLWVSWSKSSPPVWLCFSCWLLLELSRLSNQLWWASLAESTLPLIMSCRHSWSQRIWKSLRPMEQQKLLEWPMATQTIALSQLLTIHQLETSRLPQVIWIRSNRRQQLEVLALSLNNKATANKFAASIASSHTVSTVSTASIAKFEK